MSVRPLWSDGRWLRGFFAAIISRLGDVIFDLSMIVWIASDIARGASWAPAAVSGTLVAAGVSTLIGGPLAGALSGRVRVRTLILGSSLIQAVAVLSLILLPLVDMRPALQVVLIYVALVITNGAGQFFMQGRTLIMADTIPRELQNQAFGAQQAGYNILSIVGPPLAAPLLFSFGVQWAILLNGLSFLLGGLLLLSTTERLSKANLTPVKDAVADHPSFLSELTEGFTVVFRNSVLLGVFISLSVVGIGSAVLNAYLVFFIQEDLGRDATFLGVIEMCYASGSIVGSLVAAWVDKRLGSLKSFSYSLVLGALLFLAFSFMRSSVQACALLAGGAIPFGILSVVVSPMIISRVDRRLLGKAIAAINFAPAAASLLGASLAGGLASIEAVRNLHFVIGEVTFQQYSGLLLGSSFLLLIGGITSILLVGRAKAIVPQ